MSAQNTVSRQSDLVLRGPVCSNCRRPEVDCAEMVLRGLCCALCSHWTGYDHTGNPWGRGIAGRPRVIREHGTERGWQQHRHDRTAKCFACRLAHSSHTNDREATG